VHEYSHGIQLDELGGQLLSDESIQDGMQALWQVRAPPLGGTYGEGSELRPPSAARGDAHCSERAQSNTCDGAHVLRHWLRARAREGPHLGACSGVEHA